MFDTVLVANRGEIAVRVIATLRRMGIRAAAVYSDADAGAPHVRAADVAVRLGAAAAADSYLHHGRVLEAADRVGAQAVHPGYGFLAESAAFARACADAGMVFVGPPAEAIEAMGDKIRAKAMMAEAGVPVVPGVHGHGASDAELAGAADALGFPLLVKPAAGGGGKGMRVVRALAALRGELAAARREARGAFGDDTILVERLVQPARHVEVQILADRHGAVVHLGERECSLQRRHQKIVEEAPSPLLGPAGRERLGAGAVDAARACGYTGAGTVEFLVPLDRSGDGLSFFFLEMNTRLQVEHPVTEMVTGTDLVAWQLRVAAGESLSFGQDDVRVRGHAVEARVYAEDPARGFLPTGGTVLHAGTPGGEGVRVDSGIAEGVVVASHYDPLLAKVVAWAPDRVTALRRLRSALADAAVLGVTTNLAFLRALLADDEVVAARLDTGLVERRLGQLAPEGVPDDVLAAAALDRLRSLEPPGPVVDPFALPGGWRLGEHAWTTVRLRAAGREPADVRIRGRAADAQVAVGDAAAVRGAVEDHGGTLLVTVAGLTRRYRRASDGDTVWLARDGHVWALREEGGLEAARHDVAVPAAGRLLSPMPGTVTVVSVEKGQAVTAGQTLLVVEAMKMEHAISAPADGVVEELPVRPGDRVALQQPLVVVRAGQE
ncbi:MAG: acetyl/propionyl-CoA carboxylase subunit alpha [Actinobacteria bacterium]|nr:acetyl/propionyl-CoA carboxylase subunit alpha [Actinomycetota bacterium]